ncbi:hypothetical protein SAMN06265795_12134 [Noviherbaspirillum humi]|uniref:Uncharacterized protein n=2 Tax=Noviherbaspirillum humi TaxID=1688639 RepID=A0A239LE79_9BURK|nr:hypothetical protein SAMN06265795_12134 [Noviherbaspirillum humi]
MEPYPYHLIDQSHHRSSAPGFNGEPIHSSSFTGLATKKNERTQFKVSPHKLDLDSILRRLENSVQETSEKKFDINLSPNGTNGIDANPVSVAFYNETANSSNAKPVREIYLTFEGKTGNRSVLCIKHLGSDQYVLEAKLGETSGQRSNWTAWRVPKGFKPTFRPEANNSLTLMFYDEKQNRLISAADFLKRAPELRRIVFMEAPKSLINQR